MDIQKNGFLSITQAQDRFLNQSGQSVNRPQTDISFKDILAKKSQIESAGTGEVKFSKHAATRLVDRNISLSDEQLERLNGAAKMAGEKGIKESLVMVDSIAFIVNIPNNTVITALDRTESMDNVFTNIDGAVIV